MVERVISYGLLAVAIMLGAEWISAVMDVFEVLTAQGFQTRPDFTPARRYGMDLY